MTREEIAKAALEYANEEINAAPYDAFMAGAKWADRHPRWISIEEKLPIDSNNVLCKNASGELYVDSYVRRTMYGDIWRKSEKHPTHWLPLPQAPKKGGEE